MEWQLCALKYRLSANSRFQFHNSLHLLLSLESSMSEALQGSEGQRASSYLDPLL